MEKVHLCLYLHMEARGQHLFSSVAFHPFVLVLFCFEIRSLTKLELAISDTRTGWQQTPGIDLSPPQSNVDRNVWLHSVFTSGLGLQTQALILVKLTH